MTEPLYKYEYETAGGQKNTFLSRSNESATNYVVMNNLALKSAAISENFFAVKLTNLDTGRVIYLKDKDSETIYW